MKKSLFILGICLMAMVSCKKEAPVQEPVRSGITLSAVAEVTKADLGDSYDVLWQTGEEVAVRLYKGDAYVGTDTGSGYTAWDATFTLSDGAGSANAKFSFNGEVDQWLHWGYAAFYPIFDSNIGGDGKMYFHLQDAYTNYASGRIFMPMVANLSGDANQRPESMAFKHVGAGIKITLKDVPASANKLTVTVNDRGIAGWFNISPADAGTATMVPNDASSLGSTVAFEFATAEAKRDITFIVPIPATDLPEVQINLYYGDNVQFWGQKINTSSIAALGRGEMLVLPDLTVPIDPEGDVTLYFVPKQTVKNGGYLNCWDFSGDWPGLELTQVEVNENICYKLDIESSKIWGKTRTFKFVDKDRWASTSTEFTFTKKKMAYYFEAREDQDLVLLDGEPEAPAKPKSPTGPITIDGDFSDWDTLPFPNTSDNSSRIVNWNFYSDATNVYLFYQIGKDKIKFDASKGYKNSYIYIGFDLDNNPSSGEAGDGAAGGGSHGVDARGLEALALHYPWRGDTEGTIGFCNGTDSDSWIKYPIDTKTGQKITSYGKIEGNYAYLEISIPRVALGSPASGSTIVINSAMDWYPSGWQSFVLN